MREHLHSSRIAGSHELAAIFAGGALGTLARAGVVEALPPTAGSWPWATFAVNVAGALLLGAVAASQQALLPLSAHRHSFAATGLCGALTTFSTFQLELLHMLDAGRVGLALGYGAASIAVGFAALVAGTELVRRRFSPGSAA